MRTTLDDTFLLRLAELAASGETGLRDLISQQLAFARNNVVELPHVAEAGTSHPARTATNSVLATAA
jgi:hypothetical protein